MSTSSPPHINLPEDLFSEWHDAADAIGNHRDEVVENENGSVYNENNDFTPLKRENENSDFPSVTKGDGNNDFPAVTRGNGAQVSSPAIENSLLPPVRPGSSGEGFPYAPTNWPNPGDNWSWRVGKRFNNVGFFHDRFLYVPVSLRKKNSPKMFASKQTLEKYIRSQFPDADMGAFFASFSWKVPALIETPAQVDVPAVPQEPLPKAGTEETKLGGEEKTPRVSLRKRKEVTKVIPEPDDSFDEPKTKQRKKATPRTSQGKGMPKTTPKRQTRQTFMHAVPVPFEETDDLGDKHAVPVPFQGTDDVGDLSVEVPPEEFDTYLNSLDDILAQTLSEGPVSGPTSVISSANEDEMAEARIRLSLLLDMDFPSLIHSQDLRELTSLASKLQKDPSLTAEQLVKLKLIEEIPSFSKVFLENKKVIEQSNNFFEAFEANKTKISSLRKEYSELKEKVTEMQGEMDSNSTAIQQIDAQIAQLKARRNELTKMVENKKKDKLELTYNQRLVANSIPKVVNEVQNANAQRPEWERKKENAVKRENEILSKFAPLRGFSFKIGTFLDFSQPLDESAYNGGMMNFSSHGNRGSGSFIPVSRGNFMLGEGGSFMPMKSEATGADGYPAASHSRGHLSWL